MLPTWDSHHVQGEYLKISLSWNHPWNDLEAWSCGMIMVCSGEFQVNWWAWFRNPEPRVNNTYMSLNTWVTLSGERSSHSERQATGGVAVPLLPSHAHVRLHPWKGVAGGDIGCCWYLKWGRWTSSHQPVAWELFRECETQALLQSYRIRICIFNKIARWLVFTLMVEKQ